MNFYCTVALFVQNTGSALHGKYRNKNKYKMVTQRERKDGKRKEISKHKGGVGGIWFPSCPYDVKLQPSLSLQSGFIRINVEKKLFILWIISRGNGSLKPMACVCPLLSTRSLSFSYIQWRFTASPIRTVPTSVERANQCQVFYNDEWTLMPTNYYFR